MANRNNKKNGLKIYNVNEFRDLISEILSSEGFKEGKLKLTDITINNEDVKSTLSELINIALESQKLLTHYDVNTLLIHRIITFKPLDFFKSENLQKVRTLSKQPPIVHLLILLHKERLTPHQISWLKIGIYLAIVMKALGRMSYYKDIIVRFKMPLIRKTAVYTWLYDEFPTISVEKDLSFINLISYFAELIKRIEPPADSKDPDKGKKQKVNQVLKLSLYLELISGNRHAREITKEINKVEEDEKEEKDKEPKDKLHKPKNIAIYQKSDKGFRADVPSYFNPSLVKFQPYDMENNLQGFSKVFFSSIAYQDQYKNGKPIDINEFFDTLGKPIHKNLAYQDKLYAQSQLLQLKELDVQQLNISLREIALITSPTVLSEISYKEIFSVFVRDAKLHEPIREDTIELKKSCASVCLLSMLSASRVEAFTSKAFLKDLGIFNVSPRKATIIFLLGITRPKRSYDSNIHENEFDKVEIPLPHKLPNYLLSLEEMPNLTQIQDYLSNVREELGLVYLSNWRIESSLQVVLSSYILTADSHTSEIICRISSGEAPAMFYSSHENLDLVNCYRDAMIWLNQDNLLNLDYLWNTKNFSTGSQFALKIEFVKATLAQLRKWVMGSSNQLQLFNSFSIYTWIIFCVLTGIRPNNKISDIQNIDLEMGWLMIDDKPNRSVKSHRLVPLGKIVIEYLHIYKRFLSDFRHQNIANELIRHKIENILFGTSSGTSENHQLLNLITETFEKISSIKRGQVWEMMKPILDLTPYWTRHFVRTQLEKRKIPMPLINAIIGHERFMQEALGEFSSLSKSDIKDQAIIFDDIARDLDIYETKDVEKQILNKLREIDLCN